MKFFPVLKLNTKVISDFLLVVTIAGVMASVGYAGKRAIDEALTMLCGNETVTLMHLSIMN